MVKPLFLAKAALAAICCIAFAGCATIPMTQVKQFGQTTSELSTHATEALNYLDRIEVQRKLHDVAANPGVGPKRSTFQPLFSDGVDPSPADDVDSRRQALELRLKLLRSLSGYAGALDAIASAQHYDQLAAATTELNAALSGLSNTYQDATGSPLGVAEADIGLFSTAVYALGRARINKAQHDALKRIVPATDPHIRKSAELLARDLGPHGDLGTYAKAALNSIQIDMQTAYNTERKQPSSRYDERLAQLERIERFHQASATLPPFFAAVSASSAKMADAHAALSSALQSESLGGAEVAKSMAEFRAQVDAVKAFNDALDAGK